jgi:hypothetical protein
MRDTEQLSIWNQVKIRNKIEITIPGSKTIFEFGPNLLGVQTSLEKSDKFPKILICLGLPECEFRLTWLHGEIWSFHTGSIWLGLKVSEKRVWIEIQTNPSSIPLDPLSLQPEEL